MARWETHRTDGNAETLIGAAEALGMSVVKLNRPVDLLVGQFALSVAVEVKTPKGKTRPDQEKFFREFKGAKRIWRTTEDVIATHQELRAQAHRLRVEQESR